MTGSYHQQRNNLIDQSIMRRLDSFIALLLFALLLFEPLFIERVHKRELVIGVFFRTHVADCTRERSLGITYQRLLLAIGCGSSAMLSWFVILTATTAFAVNFAHQTLPDQKRGLKKYYLQLASFLIV